MKLKCGQIRDIYLSIKAIPKSSIEVEVLTHLDLAMNADKLEPIYEGIKNGSKPVEGYDKYEKALEKIASQYSPKSRQGTFSIPQESLTEFKRKKSKIDSQFKEVFDKQKEKQKEVDKMLETEKEVDLIQIKSTDLKGTLKDAMSKEIVLYLRPLFSDR